MERHIPLFAGGRGERRDERFTSDRVDHKTAVDLEQGDRSFYRFSIKVNFSCNISYRTVVIMSGRHIGDDANRNPEDLFLFSQQKLLSSLYQSLVHFFKEKSFVIDLGSPNVGPQGPVMSVYFIYNGLFHTSRRTTTSSMASSSVAFS